jgi:DNA-binding CsgD family transcriptional regulator
MITKREKEVVEWLIRGLIIKEIAVKLGVTERTVKAHIINARTRIGARTTAQLVAKYVVE